MLSAHVPLGKAKEIEFFDGPVTGTALIGPEERLNIEQSSE
jgi:hypothetical protein